MDLPSITIAFIAAKAENLANPTPERAAEVERWRSLLASARNKDRNPESFVPIQEPDTKMSKTSTERP
jgi:hypothetical protein